MQRYNALILVRRGTLYEQYRDTCVANTEDNAKELFQGYTPNGWEFVEIKALGAPSQHQWGTQGMLSNPTRSQIKEGRWSL